MRDQKDARSVLVALGQPPGLVLWALKAEIGLSDQDLGRLMNRSRPSLSRWRRLGSAAVLPREPAEALEDLRTITALLVEGNKDGDTIRNFLRSRNAGLGNDRPLDGLRVGVGEFRRVERVTKCFIAGIAPEPGPGVADSEWSCEDD